MDGSLITVLAVPADQAAKMCGVSRATWWKLHLAKQIPLPVRLTQRTPRWIVSELRDWMGAGCPSRDDWENMKKKTD